MEIKDFKKLEFFDIQAKIGDYKVTAILSEGRIIDLDIDGMRYSENEINEIIKKAEIFNKLKEAINGHG